MKTKQYISALLVTLVFATASIQAQTARRPQMQEKEQRTTTSRSQAREVASEKARSTQSERHVQSQQVQQKKATAPARKAQKQQVRQNRHVVAPARKANNQQAYHKRTTSPARKADAQELRHAKTRNTKTVVPARRAGSMSTSQATKPAYRKANNKHYATPRYSAPRHTVKYHQRHYYGGHYHHYAYPTGKVRIHYHHDTYLHHYNVLYYPAYTHIYWTRHMYRDYRRWYPDYHWNYRYGHRIQTISVFDAQYNLGEVAMVYGRVYATWHNKETDDYLLFFGGDFPYQQFTVVLPGYVARKFSWRPERYFLGEHITTTGLITTFDGSPEIVVKHKRQVNIY